MAPAAEVQTPRVSGRSRPPRPQSAQAARMHKPTNNTSSEPPKKKRRYIPGGPGGGGRYVDEDGNEIPVGGTGPGGYNYIGPRGRIGRQNLLNGVQPVVYPKRSTTSTRTRPVAPLPLAQPKMRYTSAAHAAAVVQSDGYKPREERSWEEFHPDLDINSPMMAFSADEVEGTTQSPPATPGIPQSADGSINGADSSPKPNGVESGLTSQVLGHLPFNIAIPGTPGGGKRRPGRPPKDPVAFFTARALQSQGISPTPIPSTSATPTPKPTPNVTVNNTSAKEKLTLPQPSFRKSNTLARFDEMGLTAYVGPAMEKAGYQTTDVITLPEYLIKGSDRRLEEDLDSDALGSNGFGRVEYDMDQQDDAWLELYNGSRKDSNYEPISREIFEIAMTKIEKEWHALEKLMPRPNPRPPQTQRPRSSSAAAVNGEAQGEEQDSKCDICDDGECENSNAIVFCDGCDLAVHQDCYGVPFIPEGQWLCRKCILVGRGIPTCIFCPNQGGAFKQTMDSKWAHVLCSMWVPEVSIGNPLYMEPIMDVEKIPKNRYGLSCYICKQHMGAPIQCAMKTCCVAWHATCGRRARLAMKMKNDNGVLFVHEGTNPKAYCHEHCGREYAKDNDVVAGVKEAIAFYKKSSPKFKWATDPAHAARLAAKFPNAISDHRPDESQLTGAAASAAMGDSNGDEPSKNIWKLPSGAPIVPKKIFDFLDSSLQRFNILKRKEFSADICRYWTLKRESRRGAPLVRRLQMDTFASADVIRRDYSGPTGRGRLARRLKFLKELTEQMETLSTLSHEVVGREQKKLEAARAEVDLVDTIYFPIARLLKVVIEKAVAIGASSVFAEGLSSLHVKVYNRFYTTVLPFVKDLGEVFSVGINSKFSEIPVVNGSEKSSPSKKGNAELKERKRLVRKIIKALQPLLEPAIRAEADIEKATAHEMLKEVDLILEASCEPRADAGQGEVELPDADQNNINGIERNGHDPNGQANSKEGINGDFIDVDIPNTEDFIKNGDAGRTSTSEAEHPESTIVTVPLTEVNGNVSQVNPNHNGTNGYGSVSGSDQGSSMQPVSNGTKGAGTLTDGGVPWYMEDFQPEGTTVVGNVPSHLSEELSDLDDIEMAGMGIGESTTTVETSPPAKTKKGKNKRKYRGYK
ncbi:hypothetical protein B7494_g5948 [Chlorociboria aeruginascens]|nr:hypothetical protein B7494_g5948 [Chlorociboria aeruginascens]